MLPIGLLIGRFAFRSLVAIPKSVLVPSVALLTILGSYAVHNNIDEVQQMVILGVLAWCVGRLYSGLQADFGLFAQLVLLLLWDGVRRQQEDEKRGGRLSRLLHQHVKECCSPATAWWNLRPGGRSGCVSSAVLHGVQGITSSSRSRHSSLVSIELE